MKLYLLSLLFLVLPLRDELKFPKVYQTDKAQSSMKIPGTSTLHDWEMEAVDLEGTMDIEVSANSIDIKSTSRGILRCTNAGSKSF